MLCWLFSLFLCNVLERGSTRTNRVQKAFCPLPSESTLGLFPSFVWLPPTFTQHEHKSDFNIQQCFISVPQPTQQNTTMGRRELLPLTGTQSPLSHSSILYMSLPHQHSLGSLYLNRPSFSPSISHTGDLTQHPHQRDVNRPQLLSRPQSKATINIAAVSGMPG